MAAAFVPAMQGSAPHQIDISDLTSSTLTTLDVIFQHLWAQLKTCMRVNAPFNGVIVAGQREARKSPSGEIVQH
ncbi:Hypothetical predicted protein [Pelobates cultripes]|uniref:Uncharacterized protein n=1 Tax=Pelobates cultripes TaxID=61616 RepID=A0AAD1S0G1_PELCU|nr:Hypothetical predicted protein [Pelobates cultripes]